MLTRIVITVFVGFYVPEVSATDLRAFQHGVDFVSLTNGGYRLIWSSSPGNPPVGAQVAVLDDGNPCEYFAHDIYGSEINPQDPRVEQTPIIVMPEAQEPVSAASMVSGATLLTFEDGSESDISRHCDGKLQQRYQLFDSDMRAISGVRTVSVNGGHSGHVAKAGNFFVIAYAEGWIDGDSLDEAGTADDILLDVVDTKGHVVHHKGVAVDNGTQRDWWPLIAGASRHVLVVWQRFVNGEGYADLMYSVYDPVRNRVARVPSALISKLVYYHYDVQYLPSINRFMVVANVLGNSLLPFAESGIPATTPRLIAFLLDTQGNVISRWDNDASCGRCGSYHYYNVVREAQPAILESGKDRVEVLYPVKPNGVLSLAVSATAITGDSYWDSGHYWFPLGSDGIFLNKQRAYFVNLTPQGIKSITVDLEK